MLLHLTSLNKPSQRLRMLSIKNWCPFLLLRLLPLEVCGTSPPKRLRVTLQGSGSQLVDNSPWWVWWVWVGSWKLTQPPSNETYCWCLDMPSNPFTAIHPNIWYASVKLLPTFFWCPASLLVAKIVWLLLWPQEVTQTHMSFLNPLCGSSPLTGCESLLRGLGK